MKLRIISGRFRGRSVVVGRGADGFRPTLERHRESVSQILSRWAEGAVVADVCAGSGVCGFELLSRGAAHVDFVERDRSRARAIQTSARQLEVENEVSVLVLDARRFTAVASRRYDIVYFDPPYEDDALAGLVPELLQLVGPGGVLAYERSSRRPPCACAAGSLYLADSRVFGTTAVDFFADEPLRRGRAGAPSAATDTTGGMNADRIVSGNV